MILPFTTFWIGFSSLVHPENKRIHTPIHLIYRPNFTQEGQNFQNPQKTVWNKGQKSLAPCTFSTSLQQLPVNQIHSKTVSHERVNLLLSSLVWPQTVCLSKVRRNTSVTHCTVYITIWDCKAVQVMTSQIWGIRQTDQLSVLGEELNLKCRPVSSDCWDVSGVIGRETPFIGSSVRNLSS